MMVWAKRSVWGSGGDAGRSLGLARISRHIQRSPALGCTRQDGWRGLSLGRAGYCYDRGVDGILDISPFSCMNGIVSEAVYPSFSRDHHDIPCRVFYFDGVNTDLDRDIGIFMELVRGYMSRKHVKRTYPAYFS